MEPERKANALGVALAGAFDGVFVEASNGCMCMAGKRLWFIFLYLLKTADRFSKPLLSTTQPPLRF
jgi:hypothetical protein